MVNAAESPLLRQNFFMCLGGFIQLTNVFTDKRFVDHSQRVVNPVKPSGNHVTINEPARNGNARDAAEALLGAPSSGMITHTFYQRGRRHSNIRGQILEG